MWSAISAKVLLVELGVVAGATGPIMVRVAVAVLAGAGVVTAGPGVAAAVLPVLTVVVEAQALSAIPTARSVPAPTSLRLILIILLPEQKNSSRIGTSFYIIS